MIQKSTSLKYEPSLELLLITAKQLFSNRVFITSRLRPDSTLHHMRTCPTIMLSAMSGVGTPSHVDVHSYIKHIKDERSLKGWIPVCSKIIFVPRERLTSRGGPVKHVRDVRGVRADRDVRDAPRT